MAAMQFNLVFVCLGSTHIPSSSSFSLNFLLLQHISDSTEQESVAFILNYAHSLLLVLYPRLGACLLETGLLWLHYVSGNMTLLSRLISSLLHDFLVVSFSFPLLFFFFSLSALVMVSELCGEFCKLFLVCLSVVLGALECLSSVCVITRRMKTTDIQVMHSLSRSHHIVKLIIHY
ncbi:hypothetical protein ASPTUDRAFT_431716 [Aspergillus tubingensis CBS 134.48]|uniref:Uncharacterized protein n=1 Tax=Aspergillus tubingensis (strain CBS 134.48) TaxID=767770 RepID=A0A1L9NE94_ASPTC|nr:hypothetical protein ASPTUDRAFT_431716 [Aspergillus tubingensis CBS 134.48]